MFSTMALGLSPPTPNLQYLPAELVDEIAQYLFPISKLSLRYTCYRFRHHFAVTIESLHSTKPSSNTEERAQWYNFICMLERDQRISQLVCSACKQTHHISLFSQSAQERFPRRCLASEGLPWVCPHASYTRAEISLLRLGAHASAYKHAPPPYGLLGYGLRLLKDYCLFHKDYCLWGVSHPGIHARFPVRYDRSGQKFKFPAYYYCSCRNIKASQHMLYFHIEATTFRLLQARMEKALGMSAVVKCVHLRNPPREPVRCIEHEDCWKLHKWKLNEGHLSSRCRLCMEYGVVNDMSK